MEISPNQSKSNAGAAKRFGPPPTWRILHRRIIAAAATLLLLTGIASIAPVTAAQEERPQIIPGERKVPRKKDAGPRAVAVLRMASNGKASLVPIAILINGKFWDASAYKADPIPMALESGTVYEGERSGNSMGLFTVGGALHSNAANAPVPWIGTGSWSPVGSEQPAPKEIKPASSTPVGIDTEDAPPRLTHDPNAAKAAPSANGAPSANAPSSTHAPSSSPPKSSPDSDEPPRLTKPASPAPTSTPGEQGQPAPGSSPQPSAQSKPADAKPDNQPKIAASDSGTAPGNRPILRRGKPAESFADEDVPGYSKPGATPSASPAGAQKPLEPTATEENIRLIPAISDAAGPAPHSFTFEWLKGEEDDRRKQMMALAKDQLRAYLAAQAKAKITPAPIHSSPAHRAAKAGEPILDDVKMVAYDLWNSNQPIIVFSATAHMPPPPVGTAHSEVQSDLQYSILLVTYPDIYNNLRKLYSGITDKFHLDVTPRLELVDAVDADGDGRGELLFRETSDIGSGWVIYRATADKLWKMFDSLSPE